jgi:cytochrome d ubiquinol oxidase subunit II
MVPALVFGVAFGNLLQGVPFHYDEDLRPFYTGSFFGLLNPFALLVGVVSLTMLVMHGAIFLQIKTEGVIQQRAKNAAKLFGVIFVAAFALAGVWVAFGITGYHVVTMPDPNAMPNITAKVVEQKTGGWLDNYATYPWMILAPVLGFLGAVLALYQSGKEKPGMAFICSSFMLAGVILTAGFSMFPFIMPSSTSSSSSLLMWDAVSSHLTLTWMFWAVVFFLPIVLAYTSWVYRIMRGKVTEEHVQENQHSMY